MHISHEYISKLANYVFLYLQTFYNVEYR